jgi:hypothetical protein
MKLMNKGNGDDSIEENNENANSDGPDAQNGDSNNPDLNDENRPSSLLFDFSNNSEMLINGSAPRRKRKHNIEKDKYLQEPQYVTKRTSSGRLVKMKIINDYDYTSDQEQDGKKKKSKLFLFIFFD